MERLTKDGEGQKAGILQDDFILSWSRGDSKGEIRSPFDLSEVETEQEPRGQVFLYGSHVNGDKETWTMGIDKWGLETRPSSPFLLGVQHQVEDLAKQGRFADASAIVQSSSADLGAGCSWAVSWVFFHAGEVLSAARNWKGSDAFFREAAARATDPVIKAQILRSWAATFGQRSDWAAVEAHQLEAIEESKKLGVPSLALAKSYGAIGSAADSRGDFRKAESYTKQGLSIREELAPESLDLAINLNNLGAVEDDLGELDVAWEYYRRALVIKEKLHPDSIDLAKTLNNIGIVADERGDLEESDHYHKRALEIRERLEPGGLEMTQSLDNLGNVSLDRGDLAQAEDYYRRALAIRVRLEPDSVDLAETLGGLGNVAGQRGDFSGAEKYHRRSLEIMQRHSADSSIVAIALNNLAGDAQYLGDLSKAESYGDQALAIWQKVDPGSLNAASVLETLGNVAYARGDLTKAEGYYTQSLEIRQKFAPHGPDAAASLREVALVAHDRGDLTKSAANYRQAVGIERSLAPDSVGYAESLADLAPILRAQGQTESALNAYAEAVDVFDRQMSRLGGSSDVRANFRAQHSNYYTQYADLLLNQQKPEDAFQVIERSRARTLLEILAQAHIDIRQGADPQLIEKERLLQATLKAKADRKIELMTQGKDPEHVSEVNRQIEQVMAQYQEVEGQIRSTSPRYANLTQPKPLTTKQVQQQLLDPDTVLLEYALGDDRSHLFVVTSGDLNVWELPKRIEIESAARRVYELLIARNRHLGGETAEQRGVRFSQAAAEYEKAAARLSEMVLGPVVKQLEGKRLMIVPDGALHYVSFGALPIPTQGPAQPGVPLIAEHEIVSLPSASALGVLRQQSARRATKPVKEVAILADPVFEKSDPRLFLVQTKSKTGVELAAKQDVLPASGPEAGSEPLTRSLSDLQPSKKRGGLARLIFSRREAAAIMAVARPDQSVQALDFAASRQTATSKDLGQYEIVHFATHGLLDNEHPELSGLVLSLVDRTGKPQDGFLDLEDIYNLDLPVDLVVLSACETGLGKEVNGEGLVGLTRGFIYAGATRVVASLWQVDDAATAELMGAFYKAMLKDGLSPAAALRKAQQQVMQQKRFNSPYYWAAFTLQGEWK